MRVAVAELEPGTPGGEAASLASRSPPSGAVGHHYRTAYAVILLLAVILRGIRFLISSDDTFYPDETFQLVEQAHRFAFGYGFVPWEFEVGLRNWLLPGALGFILKGLDFLHLGTPEIYVPVIGLLSFAMSLSLVEAARRTADRLGGPLAGLFAAFSVAFYTACAAASLKMTPEVMAGYALAWAFFSASAPTASPFGSPA